MAELYFIVKICHYTMRDKNVGKAAPMQGAGGEAVHILDLGARWR
jgi:hypothetical protein